MMATAKTGEITAMTRRNRMADRISNRVQRLEAEAMKTAALLLCLALSSCCTTRIRAISDRQGHLITVAMIQGDGPVTVSFQNAYCRVSFVSPGLIHSTPEAAFWTGLSSCIVNAGTAVAASFAAWFAHVTAAKL
jgi:hypothetical protein